MDVKPKTPRQIHKKTRLEGLGAFIFLFLFMRHGSRDSHDAPSTKNVFFVNVKQTALFASHDFSTGLEVNIVHFEKRATFYTFLGCHSRLTIQFGQL